MPAPDVIGPSVTSIPLYLRFDDLLPVFLILLLNDFFTAPWAGRRPAPAQALGSSSAGRVKNGRKLIADCKSREPIWAPCSSAECSLDGLEG